MKIGYWTYGDEQTPLEESLPRLAALGYQGIELCTQPGYATPLTTLDARRLGEIKRLLAAHGLEAAAVDAHWGLVAADPAAWAERRATFARSIEVAVELGAPIVELSAGGVPAGWERERAWEAAVGAAREIASLAGERGVTLALEGHVGAIVERPEEALALMEAVDTPAFRLNLDLVHPFVLGYDLPTIVELLGAHAVFAHVSDASGRYPQHEFSTPGEGDVDWPAYVRLLQNVGYDGYLMVQIPAMRRRRPGYDPLATARRAFTTLTRALGSAGGFGRLTGPEPRGGAAYQPPAPHP